MKIQEKNNPNLPLVIFSDLIVVDDKLNIISDSMVKHQKLNPSIANSFELLKCQNVVTGQQRRRCGTRPVGTSAGRAAEELEAARRQLITVMQPMPGGPIPSGGRWCRKKPLSSL